MKTYLINLPQRTDRLKNVLEYALPSLTIVEAVHFSKLSITEKISYARKLCTPGNRIDSEGAMGCFLSHVSVWESVSRSTEEFALVLEDDVNFKSDYSMHLDKIVNELNNEIEILFIGGGFEGDCLKDGIYKPAFDKKYAFCTEAYIISKKLTVKLLDIVRNKKFTTYNIDWYLHNLGKANEINYYGYHPLICFQKHNDSDIR